MQNKLTIIYDGDCGFCQSTVDFIRKLDWLNKFDFVPFQQEGILKQHTYLTQEMCEQEIYLYKKDSNKYHGGYDAFKIMTLYIPLTFTFSWFFFLPGVVHLGRIVYRIVAKNRHKIKIGNKSCKY